MGGAARRSIIVAACIGATALSGSTARADEGAPPPATLSAPLGTQTVDARTWCWPRGEHQVCADAFTNAADGFLPARRGDRVVFSVPIQEPPDEVTLGVYRQPDEGEPYGEEILRRRLATTTMPRWRVKLAPGRYAIGLAMRWSDRDAWWVFGLDVAAVQGVKLIAAMPPFANPRRPELPRSGVDGPQLLGAALLAAAVLMTGISLRRRAGTTT